MNGDRMFYATGVLCTFMGYMMTLAVELVVLLLGLIYPEVNSFNLSNAQIIPACAVLSTIVMTTLREQSLKFKDDVRIYNLNKLHACLDVLVITLGVVTGLFSNGIFIVYVLIAVFQLVIDLILNLLIKLKFGKAKDIYNGDTLAVYCYTYKQYSKCKAIGEEGK